jgi:hypothetical protein
MAIEPDGLADRVARSGRSFGGGTLDGRLHAELDAFSAGARPRSNERNN